MQRATSLRNHAIETAAVLPGVCVHGLNARGRGRPGQELNPIDQIRGPLDDIAPSDLGRKCQLKPSIDKLCTRDDLRRQHRRRTFDQDGYQTRLHRHGIIRGSKQAHLRLANHDERAVVQTGCARTDRRRAEIVRIRDGGRSHRQHGRNEET